jgi:hypothetical protein
MGKSLLWPIPTLAGPWGRCISKFDVEKPLKLNYSSTQLS